MPALDALTMKRILHEDLDTGIMRSYLQSFMESNIGDNFGLAQELLQRSGHEAVMEVVNKGKRGPAPKLGVPAPNFQSDILYPHGADSNWYAAKLRRGLEVGEAFYVAPHMLELAQAAGESMPDEDIHLEDLPTMEGFMWLPQPIRIMDIRGRFLSINAISWMALGGRVEIYQWTDKNDPNDMINVLMREQMSSDQFSGLPRLGLAMAGVARFGQPLPRAIYNTTLIEHPEDLSIYREGDNLLFHTSTPLELTTLEVKRDPVSQTLLAIWRLMQQPIIDVCVEDAPRHLRKQMRRAKLTDERVTVIQLRRREAREHGQREVEWDHRWIVRGHWRKQPCKVEGEWTHRVIWISPYLKGPEGKPLIIRDRINALLR